MHDAARKQVGGPLAHHSRNQAVVLADIVARTLSNFMDAMILSAVGQGPTLRISRCNVQPMTIRHEGCHAYGYRFLQRGA